MKERIINIKNILRIIISVLIIFSMFKSCAKALTMEEVNQMLLETKNSKVNSWQRNAFYNDGMRSQVQSSLSKKVQNYDNLLIVYLSYLGSNIDNIGYYLYNEPNEIIVDSNYKLNMTIDGIGATRNSNSPYELSWSTNPKLTWNVFYNGSTNVNYYGLTGITKGDITNIGNVRNYFLGWLNYNATTYLEYDNKIENTAYNSSLITNYVQGNIYNTTQLLLGQIIPNDSYYYEVRLKETVSGITIGTIYYDVNSNTLYNDGAIFQDNQKNIWVTTRLVNYNTQYQLEVESYYRRRWRQPMGGYRLVYIFTSKFGS